MNIQLNPELGAKLIPFPKTQPDFLIKGQPAQEIIQAFIQLYKQHDAKNFLTLTFQDGADKYEVTIQNRNGELTPHEKLSELQKQVDGLNAALEYSMQMNEQLVDSTVEQENEIANLAELLEISSTIDEKIAELTVLKTMIQAKVLAE